jgi:hypothetical protein
VVQEAGGEDDVVGGGLAVRGRWHMPTGSEKKAEEMETAQLNCWH